MDNRKLQSLIDRGVDEFRRNPEAVLLDVRSREEYGLGHIPNSQNLPLQNLDQAQEFFDMMDIPLYVYCRSGVRSKQAVALLGYMGYSNVRNIGGILGYSGELEQ